MAFVTVGGAGNRNRTDIQTLATSCNNRYTILAYKNGGADRDRTYDLFRAREPLSQLSYSPTFILLTVYLAYL
jgi:5-methylcytosine-specific restriction endonuclease McrA